MASSITFKVDGLSELGRRMSTLKSDVSAKFAPRATGKGAQVVKKAAKANLRASPSIESGLLEKNIIVKKLGKSQTELTAEHIVTVRKKIYPRKGKEKKQRNTRQIGIYKEFGTVNIPAEPYLRPALSENIDQSIAAIAGSLESDLKKAGA